MSIIRTVLIFAILPAVIIAVVAALSLAGSAQRRARRYRPGRPYDFAPIWFLARPEQVGAAVGASAPAIGSGVNETGARVPAGATGGASDRW